jgi:GTP-binding protein
MDLPEVQGRWEDIQRKLKKKGISPIGISAVTGTNLKTLLYKALELLRETPITTSETTIPIYHPQNDPKKFEIQKMANGWRIIGMSIERAAAMTYWDNDDSIRRFQRILEALGIDNALREAGVKEGDLVSVGDYELEWSD